MDQEGSYRTPSVTHSDVTFDIQRRGSSEPERLHVRVHLRLEHPSLRPRAPETGDQLVIYGTAERGQLVSLAVQLEHYISRPVALLF